MTARIFGLAPSSFDTYEKERRMPQAFEGLNDLEISQLDADHRYWQKRLTASEQELDV
jgi:hypothetical protein